MSYVIQLPDRSFIIVDGGTNTDNNKATLYNYLISRTPDGPKPEIACWFITHTDVDHVGLATNFIKEYKDKIIVNSFAYNFPDPAELKSTVDNVGGGGNGNGVPDAYEGAKKNGEGFVKAVAASFPNAKIITPSTGAQYLFVGLTADILRTCDDSDAELMIANDATTVIRFTFTDSGKTFLVLGDLQDRTGDEGVSGCTKLVSRYGSALNSDVLQVTHHGLYGGTLSLYEAIAPSVCLWSTPYDTIESKGFTTKDFNKYLWELKGTKHYYSSKTVTLIMGNTITIE